MEVTDRRLFTVKEPTVVAERAGGVCKFTGPYGAVLAREGDWVVTHPCGVAQILTHDQIHAIYAQGESVPFEEVAEDGATKETYQGTIEEFPEEEGDTTGSEDPDDNEETVSEQPTEGQA